MNNSIQAEFIRNAINHFEEFLKQNGSAESSPSFLELKDFYESDLNNAAHLNSDLSTEEFYKLVNILHNANNDTLILLNPPENPIYEIIDIIGYDCLDVIARLNDENINTFFYFELIIKLSKNINEVEASKLIGILNKKGLLEQQDNILHSICTREDVADAFKAIAELNENTLLSLQSLKLILSFKNILSSTSSYITLHSQQLDTPENLKLIDSLHKEKGDIYSQIISLLNHDSLKILTNDKLTKIAAVENLELLHNILSLLHIESQLDDNSCNIVLKNFNRLDDSIVIEYLMGIPLGALPKTFSLDIEAICKQATNPTDATAAIRDYLQPFYLLNDQDIDLDALLLEKPDISAKIDDINDETHPSDVLVTPKSMGIYPPPIPETTKTTNPDNTNRLGRDKKS